MRKLFGMFLVIGLLASSFYSSVAEACGGCGGHRHRSGYHGGSHGGYPIALGCGSHGGCGGGGFYGRGALGYARPAYYGPYGRYPKLAFRAPIRRALGLPGYTPIRQFLFGRGHIRRANRRAFLFGW
jgi:hypothetical protein